MRPIIWSFFETYPDAVTLSQADPGVVACLIKPLGFQNKRARTLVRFSKEYATGNWNEPLELFGIGKYAADSWELFVNDNVEDVYPTDKKLTAYRRWRLNGDDA